VWGEGEEIMFKIKPLTRKSLIICVVMVFLSGWFLFAGFLYTNQILFIPIEGVISDFQVTTLALHQAQIDDNVKAVVLYINTPGGAAYPCIEIGHYVNETKAVKPVIAVLGAQCTSGGYYIASFATNIFVHENTLTGGIGVLSVWVDMSEYYNQTGIKIWHWQNEEATLKDFGAEWRSPTEEEQDMIQNEVNMIAKKILHDIQINRDLSEDLIQIIATGDVFLGSYAMELGLVDEIGNIYISLEKAAQMVGLWKFMVCTPEMTDRERFLSALL
jgi:protease-4